MVDLTKFSKDDLKKSVEEINAYLKKAEEKDFDPNQSTPDAAHLEDSLKGKTKEISDKGTETKKADESNGDMSEQMTAPSQGDAMQQILALLQEILGKLNVPAPTPEVTPTPAPTDQIQHSETPAPVATPSTSSPSTSTTATPKGDININVTKAQVEEILKGMGFTPSMGAVKPKVDNGHPIEKAADLTYSKIAKMSWAELDAMNAQLNPGPYY